MKKHKHDDPEETQTQAHVSREGRTDAALWFAGLPDSAQMTKTEVGAVLGGICARTVKARLLDTGLLNCVAVSPKRTIISAGDVRSYLAKESSVQPARALAPLRRRDRLAIAEDDLEATFRKRRR